MTTKNKILAGLAALGIAGAGFSGVDNACLDKDGITMFPAEELTLREYIRDEIRGTEEIIETGKVCFKNEGDYVVYREYHVDTYLGMTNEDRALWFLTDEGSALDDILTHEIKKRGTVSFPYNEKTDDVFLKIIDELKL